MGSVDLHYLALGVGTLALMIAIHVWAKGQLRTYSIILSVLIAYGCALYYGLVDAGALDTLSQASWFHVPLGGWQLPSFRGDLIVPFAFAALVCSLSVMGDITTCQKINDDEWVRPDMISLRNGVLTDGVCTAVSALIGSVGGDTSSPNVGLSSAAGVTSRVVGYWTGGLLILLAMMPVVAAAVVSIPRPIMGAAMLFTSCFVLINGLEIIMSRLLDARRTLVVGLALTLALSRDLFPTVYDTLPGSLQSFAASDLVIGLFTALILNAVFRLGVRNRVSMSFDPRSDDVDRVREFLDEQGGKWGARRDIMAKAVFGATQSIEVVGDYCEPKGPIVLEAAFDEFNLDLRLTYDGKLLELQHERPTEDELLESDDGVLKLAGYLVRRNADRVRASRAGEHSVLEFHFQH
jgi:NCS2 family nucleobase:cation symporter-2